jgi:hypothetical protein
MMANLRYRTRIAFPMSRLFQTYALRATTLAILGSGVRFAHVIWSQRVGGIDSFGNSTLWMVQMIALMLAAFAIADAGMSLGTNLRAIFVVAIVTIAAGVVCWKLEPSLTLVAALTVQFSELLVPILFLSTFQWLCLRSNSVGCEQTVRSQLVEKVEARGGEA